jgi:hypothetical protein
MGNINNLKKYTIMNKYLLLFLLLFSLYNVQAQQNKTAEKYAKTITASELKKKLTVIASAEMEGRETAMPGQKKAAAYIENTFKKAGLLPAYNSSYQMPFSVYRDTLLKATLQTNQAAFTEGKDFAVSSYGFTSGTWNIPEITYVAYGLTDSLHDDYDGLNVKNKWLMLWEGLPADQQTSNAARASFMKLFQARNKGVKGLFIISSTAAEKTGSRQGNMYVKPSSYSLPMVYISPETAAAILNLSATEMKHPENIIRGIYPARLSLTVQTKTDTLQSTNVIGLIPGTDLKEEYVFITAHYDHLGKKDSVIYFGADDDGSGTTTVLQLAEAFAKAKKQGSAPRRTIVFMTVSGEEKGLWGSDYYTSHPIFPLSKTSVDLNIDMVGRIDPNYNGDSLNYVYLIGEDKLSSRLQPITDSINNNYLHMELDRRFNDPNDPERFYYRSDHFNFAKNGVPIIFYFNGTHADYHKPTDTIDKIQFSLMEKRARLVFYTAWDMANRNEMLPRDKPL